MSDLSSLANTSVVNYVSFCLIFFVLKYKYFAEDKFMWIIVFFIVACMLQFVNNLYLSSLPLFCGGVQVNISLYATLFPWIIIFGSFAICLIVFPGWLRAFSNTFGIKAAQMFGIEDAINKLFDSASKDELASNARARGDIDLLKAIDNCKDVYIKSEIIKDTNTGYNIIFSIHRGHNNQYSLITLFFLMSPCAFHLKM